MQGRYHPRSRHVHGSVIPGIFIFISFFRGSSFANTTLRPTHSIYGRMHRHSSTLGHQVIAWTPQVFGRMTIHTGCTNSSRLTPVLDMHVLLYIMSMTST